jgi:hypothetical protein
MYRTSSATSRSSTASRSTGSRSHETTRRVSPRRNLHITRGRIATAVGNHAGTIPLLHQVRTQLVQRDEIIANLQWRLEDLQAELNDKAIQLGVSRSEYDQVYLHAGALQQALYYTHLELNNEQQTSRALLSALAGLSADQWGDVHPQVQPYGHFSPPASPSPAVSDDAPTPQLSPLQLQALSQYVKEEPVQGFETGTPPEVAELFSCMTAAPATADAPPVQPPSPPCRPTSASPPPPPSSAPPSPPSAGAVPPPRRAFKRAGTPWASLPSYNPMGN